VLHPFPSFNLHTTSLIIFAPRRLPICPRKGRFSPFSISNPENIASSTLESLRDLFSDKRTKSIAHFSSSLSISQLPPVLPHNEEEACNYRFPISSFYPCTGYIFSLILVVREKIGHLFILVGLPRRSRLVVTNCNQPIDMVLIEELNRHVRTRRVHVQNHPRIVERSQILPPCPLFAKYHERKKTKTPFVHSFTHSCDVSGGRIVKYSEIYFIRSPCNSCKWPFAYANEKLT